MHYASKNVEIKKKNKHTFLLCVFYTLKTLIFEHSQSTIRVDEHDYLTCIIIYVFTLHKTILQ